MTKKSWFQLAIRALKTSLELWNKWQLPNSLGDHVMQRERESMVSFHTPLSPSRREGIAEMENLTKKRKWEESQVKEVLDRKPIWKAKGTKSMFDMELHFETPFPLEWQRCLDIKVN